MIARNMYTGEMNILYPRIDMAGEKTGIIGSEFPFFNFLIAGFNKVFGFQHWYGRLINLIVTSIGIYCFYDLVKRYFTKSVAFWAAIFLLTSCWFSFSRKIMPDTFSVALVLIGLFSGSRYFDSGKTIYLLCFIVFSTLGMLCKIPAAVIFATIGLILFLSEYNFKRKVWISAGSILSVLIVSWWYFSWVPHLLETYHFQLYFPKTFGDGISEIGQNLHGFFKKFYFSAFDSYLAFGCFLGGLVFILIRRNLKALWVFLIVTIPFFGFIIKTGLVFPTHNYYIIPYVPLMALIAGVFMVKLSQKWRIAIICLVATESLMNQQHDFFIQDKFQYKLGLEELLKQELPDQGLIILNTGQSPQDMYFANKKGWTIDGAKLESLHFVDSLNTLGAQYLVIDKNFSHPGLNRYQMIHESADYSLYSIQAFK